MVYVVFADKSDVRTGEWDIVCASKEEADKHVRSLVRHLNFDRPIVKTFASESAAYDWQALQEAWN
jgi:hypothetical protein